MTGIFPLNVQEGSPQYTLTYDITPSSSTTDFQITSTHLIYPISNAYYTIQNEDGSKWCTFYVSKWATITESSIPTHTATCTYSSSNTSDVFPEGSICWCIWCKEYYDSLVTPISTNKNDISTINNKIDTLTPKVDNSFVNASKIGDTTLRLTRNDGTTVDISFPEGLNVRIVNLTDYQDITANTNELVVITGNIIGTTINNYTLSISGLGFLEFKYDTYSGDEVKCSISNITSPTSFSSVGSYKIPVSGLLYNGASLTRS